MRVLLPEPLTPVTQVKYPRGMEASIVFKLWAEAPRRWSQSRGWKGRGGKDIFLRPERNEPVRESVRAAISLGVPWATRCPPSEPAPGPNSMR